MPIQNIEPINAQEIRLLIARIERVAGALRAAEVVLEEAGELYVFRKKSMGWGIDRLESVVPEIERSLLAYRSGQPYGPDTSKGREVKKKAAPKKTAKKTTSKKAAVKKGR